MHSFKGMVYHMQGAQEVRTCARRSALSCCTAASFISSSCLSPLSRLAFTVACASCHSTLPSLHSLPEPDLLPWPSGQ